MNDDLAALAQFAGTARLFPLPNVVLFPHVMQPLHIFERRYRQMTADALGGDRLIAMALLRPGYEADYEGRPPLYPVVCLGRIVAEQQLDDGRFNILLRGLSRGRIEEEIETGKLYRSARLELLADTGALSEVQSVELRRLLTNRATPWLPGKGPASAELQRLLENDVSLGALCDLLGFILPLPIEVKQGLLAELDVERRAQDLLGLLETHEPPVSTSEERPFPPSFSSN